MKKQQKIDLTVSKYSGFTTLTKNSTPEQSVLFHLLAHLTQKHIWGRTQYMVLCQNTF